MTTNIAGGEGREYPQQMVHYFRRNVAYNTSGIGSGITLGILPIGAQILQCLTIVKTAFNGSAPALTVGTNSTSFNNIKADGGETTTNAVIGTAASFLSFTRDTEVKVKFANGATTAASAGAATVVLSYVPNNDRGQ